MSQGLSKGAQVAIGASVIVALLGWFAYTNVREGASMQYYQTLEEFLAQGDALHGQSLRVHGYVAANSIHRNLEAKNVRFSVQNDPPHSGLAAGQMLDVLFLGLETPDLFKDGAEVVIEGRLQAQDNETVFLAENLLAKCPSKFQANPDGGVSEQRSDGVKL
jgi:cytochrome c-type biogenesis protein CcmE